MMRETFQQGVREYSEQAICSFSVVIPWQNELQKYSNPGKE